MLSALLPSSSDDDLEALSGTGRAGERGIMSRRKQAKPIRHLEDGTTPALNGEWVTSDLPVIGQSLFD